MNYSYKDSMDKSAIIPQLHEEVGVGFADGTAIKRKSSSFTSILAINQK